MIDATCQKCGQRFTSTDPQRYGWTLIPGGYYPGVECIHGFDKCPTCDAPTWLCPSCEGNHTEQTPLPFDLRPLNEADKGDLERHFDTKRYA